MRTLRILSLLLAGFILMACSSQELSSPVTQITTASPLATSTAEILAVFPTPEAYRLRPGELVLASSPGDIPAITASEDLFVSAVDGDLEWEDEELVVGVAINGEARAYPIRLLSLHEIVNDKVGGQAILVTWCPLCYSAIVFDRNVEGQELNFGVSGFLLRNNLVMYDLRSETLWSQALAQGVRGAYDRVRLEFIPSQLTTWAKWKALHSDTRVLSAVQLGKESHEVVDPYVGYYASGSLGFGGQDSLDDRLAPKALVLGLRIGEEQKAYPFDMLRNLGLINDFVGDEAVFLAYNAELNNASAFSGRVGDDILTFELDDLGVFRDVETGSIWNIVTGLAIDGPLSGKQLTQLSAPIIFWFAWSDIFPQSGLFQAP